MSIKQAIEALELAQDALDISQSLQESAKSNHHPKTLAAYERVSAALAALRSMPAEQASEPDRKDAARYRELRRGMYWSVVDGTGDHLIDDELDAEIDAYIAAEERRKP